MNTKKRIDGDYYIETINADDSVYINTSTVEVEGNLVVSGNITYINTEQLDVKDPFVMVNSSNTATYASNAGLLTHKTASTFAGIRYNTDDNKWEISTSTSATAETGLGAHPDPVTRAALPLAHCSTMLSVLLRVDVLAHEDQILPERAQCEQRELPDGRDERRLRCDDRHHCTEDLQ